MSSEPVPPSAKEVVSLPPPASSKASNNTLLNNNQLWTSPLDLFSYRHWMSDVDPQRSTMPLAAFCFMTGFMCVLDFFIFAFLRCARTSLRHVAALHLCLAAFGPPMRGAVMCGVSVRWWCDKSTDDPFGRTKPT